MPSGCSRAAPATLEQEILLAGDTLEVVEQFALDLPLGARADVMDGLDEQIDQVIGQCPAAQMHESRKPGEPGRLRMAAQFVGGLGRDTPSIPFKLMGKHAVEQPWRQLDLANQLQPGQLVLKPARPGLPGSPRSRSSNAGAGCAGGSDTGLADSFSGGSQQRFQPLSRLCCKTAQDTGTETTIMSADRGTDDPIDTIGCGRLDRKLATPRLNERGELVLNYPNGGYLISQPGFEQLGIGDGCLPKAKQGPDFRAMPFPCPAGHIDIIMVFGLHAQLPGDKRDGFSVDFLRAPSETGHVPGKTQATRRTSDESRHFSSWRMLGPPWSASMRSAAFPSSAISGVHEGCSVAKLLSSATKPGMPVNPGFYMLQKSVAKVNCFATIFATDRSRHAGRLRPRLHRRSGPTLQRAALKKAGCKRLYEEKVSGAKRQRPELNRMLDQLRAGDVLVVSRLDRLPAQRVICWKSPSC